MLVVAAAVGPAFVAVVVMGRDEVVEVAVTAMDVDTTAVLLVDKIWLLAVEKKHGNKLYVVSINVVTNLQCSSNFHLEPEQHCTASHTCLRYRSCNIVYCSVQSSDAVPHHRGRHGCILHSKKGEKIILRTYSDWTYHSSECCCRILFQI